jgi:hypothetical protein
MGEDHRDVVGRDRQQFAALELLGRATDGMVAAGSMTMGSFLAATIGRMVAARSSARGTALLKGWAVDCASEEAVGANACEMAGRHFASEGKCEVLSNRNPIS